MVIWPIFRVLSFFLKFHAGDFSFLKCKPLILINYLFVAALDFPVPSCKWTFSSCGEQGLPSSYNAWACHHSGLSRCGVGLLELAGFSSCGSRALDHRLSSWGARGYCSLACGMFLDQGSNLCFLHWQEGSLPLSHHRSSLFFFFFCGNFMLVIVLFFLNVNH